MLVLYGYLPIYKLLMLYGLPYKVGLQKQPLRKDIDFKQ